MKKWKKWSFLIGLILLVLGIFAGIQVKKSTESITQFRLIIDDYFKNEQFFVDETVLKKRLEEAGMREIKGKKVSEVNLLQLESALEQVEYVADAKAYFTLQKELVVEVSQRVPVLRVYNRMGQSYYVDQKGKLMETSPHFSAYCLTASGDIGTLYRKNTSDTTLVFKLAQVAFELEKDEATSGLFTQISVENNAIWLISRIEGFPCRISLEEPISPQVYKWLAFVSGADSTGEWRNKYEAVDLRFSNQVIALQRGRTIQYGKIAPNASDTTSKLALQVNEKDQTIEKRADPKKHKVDKKEQKKSKKESKTDSNSKGKKKEKPENKKSKNKK